MIERLFNGDEFSKEAMAELHEYYIYNVGNSSIIGAEYIVQRLLQREKN